MLVNLKVLVQVLHELCALLCSQVSKNIGSTSIGGSATSGWIKIPHTFSCSTMHAIETETVTKSACTEIVVTLANFNLSYASSLASLSVVTITCA